MPFPPKMGCVLAATYRNTGNFRLFEDLMNTKKRLFFWCDVMVKYITFKRASA
jgi:hypothetical protein